MSTVTSAHLPVGKLPGELLARLVASYATTDPSVVVGPGIGGDAAAIDLGSTMLAVKSDPITFATESPAQYLVDVNANDLACLGATPRWLMVTALLPERTTEEEVEKHFRELRDACVQRGISLVGAIPRSRSGCTGRSSWAFCSARSTPTDCSDRAAPGPAIGCS